MWIVQFLTLIVYRYAHTGRVCSGDFQKYNLVGDTDKRDQQYDGLYLRSEGAFFFRYSVICLSIFSVAFLCAIACTLPFACMQNRQAMTNIEEVFRNMDSISEIIKKQQEKQYKAYAEKHGSAQNSEGAPGAQSAGAAGKAKEAQAANDEEAFKQEF